MKKYQKLKLEKIWKLFDGAGVERADAPGARYEDVLRMAAGGEKRALDLVLENNKADLNVVLGRRVPCGTASILVNRIESGSDTPAQIGVGVDWWFVCYLNGSELYSTLESGGNRNAVPEVTDHVIELPLRKGTNTLVILFLAGSSSRKIAIGPVPFTDLSPRTAELANGPWLLNPVPGGCTVKFTSNGPMAAGIEFRAHGGRRFRRRWETVAGILRRDSSLHTFNLRRLTPGAVYEYRLLLQYTDTNQVRVLPGLYEFTVPAGENRDGRFSIFVSGDTQLMPEHRRNTVSKIFGAPGTCDVAGFVHIGDAGSTFNDFEPDYFDGLMDVFLARTRHRAFYIPLRGNHEFFGRDCVKFVEFFGTSEGRTFQAFRAGGCFFLVLDTGSGGAPDPFDAKSYMYVMEDSYLADQERWLKKIARSKAFKTAEFRVVFAHATPAMMVDWAGAMQLADRVFGPSDINLWIGGHVHSYRRSIPGTDDFLANSATPQPHRLRSGRKYAYPIITIDGPRETGVEISGTMIDVAPGRLELTTRDLENRVIDHFALRPDGTIEELAVDKPMARLSVR